jgi:hypothetical protein
MPENLNIPSLYGSLSGPVSQDYDFSKFTESIIPTNTQQSTFNSFIPNSNELFTQKCGHKLSLQSSQQSCQQSTKKYTERPNQNKIEKTPAPASVGSYSQIEMLRPPKDILSTIEPMVGSMYPLDAMASAAIYARNPNLRRAQPLPVILPNKQMQNIYPPQALV